MIVNVIDVIKQFKLTELHNETKFKKVIHTYIYTYTHIQIYIHIHIYINTYSSISWQLYCGVRNVVVLPADLLGPVARRPVTPVEAQFNES
jgi:hypothetical protein